MSGFFEEMAEQSDVKSEIVSKYFGAWATVMGHKATTDRIAYIDLFSGPGRYEDGTKSTPVKVLEQIIANPMLRNKIVTLFNDANPNFANNLESEIIKLPGIDSLTHKPQVNNVIVGKDLVTLFGKTNLVPTLSFVDPWGYKGLSSDLIWSLTKDFGSDCIFFFNYNRINMGLTNPIVVEHMNSIFGPERAESLRQRVSGMNPEERELTILNELAESLSYGKRHLVLPFRFMRPNGHRTSHYLIFVSKHPLGYTIMKDIMYKYSSEHDDGVASFSYVPVQDPQLSILFDYSRPLDELGDQLLSQFQGYTLRLSEIFVKHHIGTPFVLQNYKEALRRLETTGRIKTDPPAQERRIMKGVRTFSEKVKVTFP